MSNNPAAPLRLLVAKFGGTSVADFRRDELQFGYHLSQSRGASGGAFRLGRYHHVLVALSKGNEAERRAYYLDEIRNIALSTVWPSKR